MAVAADLVPDVRPSLEEAHELAHTANAIPVRMTFVDDCETPVSAFLKLRDSGPCFLLESAEQGRLGRYSFLGFRPRAVLRYAGGEMREWRGVLGPDAQPYAAVAAADPYGEVSRYLASYSLPEIDGLPPFAGGAVGFFGYDLVRTVEPLGEPNPDPIELPDMALMVSDVLVAFDHMRHELTLMAYAFTDEGSDLDAAYAGAVRTLAELRERLRGPVPRPAATSGRDVAEFTSNMTREQFESNVSRIIEYIHAGDAFQVVPSQRFSAPAPVEAFSIYRGLRTVNPSPYMYFLDFGDFQLAGASPEPLVKVTGRRVETRPIAGTYPRGESEEEDRRRAEDLLRDPKERAEHVMLVDLGRNDLGRVSEFGSVEVDEFMIVEAYSHVHHIVSQVSGTLRPDVTAMDALRAVLPAGTLSGAPKVRAMQIIDELEPHKRGSYGGAIGYLGFNGDLDTAIHIRTVVVKDGMVHVQAGGGTVADAKPDYEYEESINKAKAVFAAVELAVDQPDWP
jgi:anthranilate synthase component 1